MYTIMASFTKHTGYLGVDWPVVLNASPAVAAPRHLRLGGDVRRRGRLSLATQKNRGENTCAYVYIYTYIYIYHR